MKQTLIVAAVALLAAGSAAAQSSVTIYGRLNVTAEALKVNGVSTKQLVNNASRLGFRGTEDLGGGLKAGFLLEHRFNVDTGTVTGDFYAGDSLVSLSGGFGQIRLGRITSEAYYATADYISLNNHDTGTSADALYAYLGNNKNKIAYNTPDMGGLVFHASVSAGEGVTTRGYDFAAVYDSGPLHLGAGYEKQGNANQYAVRGLYELGAVTLGGYIQRDKNGYIANGGNRTTWRVTGMYTMGASELHAGYGAASKYSNTPNSGGTQWVLGYNYNLSKRTKVYGYYTKLDGKVASPYGDLTSLAVGVRHNF